MTNLQPGQMLGPYRIISQIGQGGMATVYKAYQPSMDRNVAIKVLPSQLAESREFTTRFQQEAHIIARLEHPHILPVFDYGENDGITYFVMRYLDAGTLKDKMESGALPLSEIDRIFTQLADALSYAHSEGVIHRDLKPANALIDSKGNLFLTDFGIAKILESASPRLTQTDAIMGTPAYISPEQAQARQVDQRSDIYSLGIILYEMVTGRVPFVADTPLAVIIKHVTDPLPLPSSLKPDIPDAVERVILKALAKNPDDRFATVSEFVSAWKRSLDEKDTARRALDATSAATARAATPSTPTQEMPAPSTQASPKPGRSRAWTVGCLAGACLLLSATGIILFASRSLPFLNSGSASTTEPSSQNPPSVSGDVIEEQFEIQIGDEVSNEETGEGAGLIEGPGSKDIYTFTAEAGQEVYVQIIQMPESGDTIEFYLNDDLGVDVFYGCLQCGDPGKIRLDRGGTYTITVGNDDPNGAGTGAYRFKIWEVAPPDEFSINLDDEISRNVPGPGAGYIENPGSNDVYTFTAESGQDVYFQVQEPPQTNESINWRVEDESGFEVFNTCLQCGDPGVITLERGGTYTITIGSDNSPATGTYVIKIWNVPPPDEFTISIGDTISRDDPGPGAGFIETAGSLDIYTFTATAGQTVSFSVSQQPNTNDSIYWRLEDEQENEIFNTCLQCGDPGSFTLEFDGTYTLIMGSETSPATGTYEVQVFTP